ADLAKLGLPEITLHRKGPRVAVAAMDLDRLQGRPRGRLRGEELGHGSLPGKPRSTILQPGGPVYEEPGRVELGRHVGQHPLDRLEIGYGVTEGLPFTGI